VTVPDTDNPYCPNIGYLYHERSGYCVTGVEATTPLKYANQDVQLQPCGSSTSPPPEAQAFCGQRFTNRAFILFLGDDTAAGTSPYAAQFGDGVDVPMSLSPGGNGNYWVYNCIP
jgi:hypothetical protein